MVAACFFEVSAAGATPCCGKQFRHVQASRPVVVKAFASASPQHCSVA